MCLVPEQMGSVSAGRGLCRLLPYICFYISSFFRLAVPLLCKQPIKISSWKRRDSYLCTQSKAARLEWEVPAAPWGQQHLLWPQDKPLMAGCRGTSTTAAQPPLRPPLLPAAFLAAPHGDAPGTALQAAACSPRVLCVAVQEARGPQSPPGARGCAAGEQLGLGVQHGDSGSWQLRLRQHWGTGTPRGRRCEAAPGVSRARGWLGPAAQEGTVPISRSQHRLGLAGCSCPPWHFNATAFHLESEQLRF